MNSKILMAALTGLGAGLAIGMLFAPDKGTLTRKRIVEKATDLTDRIKTTAENTRDKISELGSAARSTYDKLAGEAER